MWTARREDNAAVVREVSNRQEKCAKRALLAPGRKDLMMCNMGYGCVAIGICGSRRTRHLDDIMCI